MSRHWAELYHGRDSDLKSVNRPHTHGSRNHALRQCGKHQRYREQKAVDRTRNLEAPRKAWVLRLTSIHCIERIVSFQWGRTDSIRLPSRRNRTISQADSRVYCGPHNWKPRWDRACPEVLACPDQQRARRLTSPGQSRSNDRVDKRIDVSAWDRSSADGVMDRHPFVDSSFEDLGD